MYTYYQENTIKCFKGFYWFTPRLCSKCDVFIHALRYYSSPHNVSMLIMTLIFLIDDEPSKQNKVKNIWLAFTSWIYVNKPSKSNYLHKLTFDRLYLYIVILNIQQKNALFGTCSTYPLIQHLSFTIIIISF